MIVYCITNLADGKIYVGATQRSSLKVRWTEHKSRAFANNGARQTPLYEAMRKFGYESFVCGILERCSNVDCLHKSEKKWISILDSTSLDKGYNLTSGGAGTANYIFSESHREKISNAHKGRVQSPEIIERRIAPQRGSKRPTVSAKLKGRTLSEEHIKNIGISSLGRKNVWSDKAKKNNAEAAKNRSINGIGAKLHPSLATQIMFRRDSGESFPSIAKDYGVTASAVGYFCRRHKGVGGCHP